MSHDVTLVEALPPPRLVVRVGGRVTQEAILRAELTIGRAEDNDLTLADPKASRYHARLDRQGATYVLTDLGSANGTLVDGVRLTTPHLLRPGERITIGDTELAYEERADAFQDTITAPVVPPPPPAPPPSSGPDRNRRRWIIGVIVAAAALLLVLGGVSIFLLSQQTDLVGQTTQTPMAETAVPTVPARSPTPAETSASQTTVPSSEATVALPDETGAVFDEMLVQAEALTRRSKFEEATVIYADLVQRASDDARPEVGWAWALIFDDRADEALVHARRAAELDPTSADASAVLARAYVETGDKAPALVTAQKAVQQDPGSAEAHAALAEAYLLNGKVQDAVDEADLALVQDSRNANAHHIRGWLYDIADKDMGRAAGELQIAAGIQPELWLRRHELGELLLKAEDYSTAILAFQDALSIHPKARTYTAIGEAYYRLGQYDQARASLQQALSAGAEDLDTYALMAATSAHRGRCEDARTYYEQALALDPGEPLALEAKDICEGEGPPPSPSATTISPSFPTPITTPKPTETARPPARAPALSGQIAFPVWNGQRGKYDTFVANVDGSGRHLVAEQMHQPAFSPDGKWLAVNGERDEHMNLFIVLPDGSNLKEITEYIEDGLPYWSPDSTGLVFSSTRHGDKQSRVYIIDQVPFVGRKAQGRPLNFGPDDVRGEDPAWTSDGRIVLKGCDLTVEPAECGLFIMPAAPGPHPMTRLTEYANDTAPAAHDGKIAFMSDRDGNWEIYVMSDDGSGLKRLTSDAAIDGLPTWSPDGKTIAFVSKRGGAWAVWAMGPDGSNQLKLFEIGDGGLAFEWQHEQISWGP